MVYTGQNFQCHRLEKRKMAFYCYMVECQDGSFYTGWTVDPLRREKQHNRGVGSTYTRLHRPVRLVYIEEVDGHSSALKREMEIKKMSHAQKKSLASNFLHNEVLE